MFGKKITKPKLCKNKVELENRWSEALKDIDNTNEKIKSESISDTVKAGKALFKEKAPYVFSKRVNFMISGTKKEKFSISTWLWRTQIKLEAQFPVVRTILSFIRKVKQKTKKKEILWPQQ